VPGISFSPWIGNHLIIDIILKRTAYYPRGRRPDMAKVARELVEKTGINVEQLVELLVKNAAAELAC